MKQRLKTAKNIIFIFLLLSFSTCSKNISKNNRNKLDETIIINQSESNHEDNDDYIIYKADKDIYYGTESEPTDDVFIIVEEMPQFPGGNNKLYTWIADNIIYPLPAVQRGIEGQVFIQFVVDTDGTVINIKVIRGVHPLLDHEAFRVINSMPKWKPGKHRGKNVKVMYTMPIRFSLQ